MARLVLLTLALSLPAAAGSAQTPKPSSSPWQVSAEPRPSKSFDLASTRTNQPADNDPDGRVVAGTEVLPNGMVGFGMFGDETQSSAHSRATVRDFSIPKERKPAVGFSLKF